MVFNNQMELNVHTSCLLTNNSKRSVRPGFDLCHFAKGLIISGWLMMKVGFTHVSSKKCPTSCNGIHLRDKFKNNNTGKTENTEKFYKQKTKWKSKQNFIIYSCSGLHAYILKEKSSQDHKLLEQGNDSDDSFGSPLG